MKAKDPNPIQKSMEMDSEISSIASSVNQRDFKEQFDDDIQSGQENNYVVEGNVLDNNNELLLYQDEPLADEQ